ncbi:MAG: GIN domain-containing protein, partial [Bacteroidales bacterium]
MNIKGTVLLTLFALLSLNVSAQLIKVIEGDGKYVEKEIEIDHFTEVSLSHAFNVIYTQDKSMARKVKIRAEKNMMDLVQAVTKKGKLSLSMKKALNVDYGVVFVYCSSEELYKIRNMGSGVFEVNGTLNTPKLD